MRLLTKLFIVAAILAASFVFADGQKRGTRKPTPKPRVAPGTVVKEIDVDGLKVILKPDGKPRLINFWATWCDPCREEFPELVKLDAKYKGRIDFLAVSLDDFVDIRTGVPKFLSAMKSGMTPYLLHTSDEDAAIAAIAGISTEFRGSLPFTILIAPTGEISYSHAGKINPAILTTELEKQVTPAK